MQLAAHQLDQRAADDQAQTCALACSRAVSLGKGAEQTRLVGRTDADACVAHAQCDAQLAMLGLRGELKAGVHLPAIRELDGIAQQVGEYLLESQRVGQHPDWTGG
ncbi:hypothetical protein D9M71_765920 [compost metagenome]